MSIKTLLFAVGALAATACHDPGTPVGPTKDSDAPQLEPALQAPLDEGLLHPDVAKLVATVPGFGGLYFDGGVATVYLTDVEQRAKVEAVLAASALEEYGRVHVRQGEYTYEQLDGWFQGLSPEALALPEVVLVDLDEARNRVFVGVEHAAAAAAVRDVVDRLGLPPGAVVVEEVEPFHFAATLFAKRRPVVGGLGMWVGLWNTCTLGFNALHVGTQEFSFITNSHCTMTRGTVDGTEYHQGVAASPAQDLIGREVADPPFWQQAGKVTGKLAGFAGLCPVGKWCRYSDAARARYESGVPFQFRIARTLWVNNWPQADNVWTWEIDGSWPVTGRVNAPFAGQVANKVGSESGWTQGKISSTCFSAKVDATTVLICQYTVAAGAKDGDSGAPVFRLWGSGDRVKLLGILWGANTFGFSFSPIAGIEKDLGALQTN